MTGPFFATSAAGDILGAMITPAVLISASGTLTLSTTNRLGRIVDRVRVLQTQAETLPPWDATDLDALDKRALIADQIARQTQRIGILQAAVTALYVAISLLVGCSLTVGLSTVMNGRLGWVPTGVGLGGATALFVAAVLLIREARRSVDARRARPREADGGPPDRGTPSNAGGTQFPRGSARTPVAGCFAPTPAD